MFTGYTLIYPSSKFQALLQLNTNFYRMQRPSKPVNTDSLRPSSKPITKNKSESFDFKVTMKTHQSYKPNLNHLDSIRQHETSLLNFSSFQEKEDNRELASSFTFSEDDQQHHHQKELFSKLLLAPPLEYLSIIHEISQTPKENLVDIVKIGADQKSIKRNQIVSHYIGVWLKSMDYGSFQTKQRILMNLRFLFPNEEEIQIIGERVYDRLYNGFLPDYLHFKFLIEVCKKGWEYFSFFTVKYIRLLKKVKAMSDDEFVEEVQKIL